MNPADLPIRVRLEWPAGIVQYGSATKPNVQEFNAGGDRYVTVTAKLDPPFDHLAHAKAALDQEDTMNDYTAEDFQNAMFAVLPKYGLRAHKSAGEFYWQRDGIKRATNPEMAAAGWRPVHEHNPHATDALEEEIQDLRDENVRLKARLGILHAELTLWQERASQAEAYARKAETAPLTLDTLREAWENAEVPTEDAPMRQGDVYISALDRNDRGLGYSVAAAGSNGTHMNFNARILTRAPRQPWQDLADVLRQWDATLETGHSTDSMARWFHERGVRVTAVSHDG